MSAKKNKSNRRGWWAALMGFLAYWLWRRWRRGNGREEEGQASAPHASLQLGHEPEETSIRGVVLVGVGLVVSAVIVFLALYWMAAVWEEDRMAEGPASPFADYEQVPPPPRLQADPSVDLQLLHERENRLLFNYGWVNRAAGVVHIPIGEAMRLIAERGLPVRDTALTPLDDTLVVMTESGFVRVERGPPFPRYTPPPYLGSSPDPYTPVPNYRRYLTEEGYLMRPATRRDAAL